MGRYDTPDEECAEGYYNEDGAAEPDPVVGAFLKERRSDYVLSFEEK